MDYLAPAGGLEYSGPYHGFAAVGGRLVAGPRGYATTAAVPETRRPTPPRVHDLPVIGRALGYGVVIRDDHGHTDVFDADTEWDVDPAGVGLYVNHGPLAGRVRIVRGEDGLWANGVVYAGMKERVAGQDFMSARLTSLGSRALPDGTIHHTRARVVEVSLTARPCCPGTAVVYGVRVA